MSRYDPAFGEPVSDWFRWFAWRPVETIDRGWRWLRPVWRRRVHRHQYLRGGADFWFQECVTRPETTQNALPQGPRIDAQDHPGVVAHSEDSRPSEQYDSE